MDSLPSKKIQKKRVGFFPKLLAFTTFGGVCTAGLVYSGALESMGVKPDLGGLLGGEKIMVVSYKVNKGALAITVKERGNLESSKNEDVMSEVEGSTTIIKILPEGSRVRKGELVCELDSAALKDQLTNQRITVQQAEAAYQNSKLTREVAEIARDEYLEGTYMQDIRQAEGEKALAETEMFRAKDRLAWANEMFKKGYLSSTQKVAEEANLQRATFNKEQAETKITVLKDYTKKKMVTDLNSNIEKAKADELAKQATLVLEKDKENKLVAQIEKCKLLAPNEGLVVYANDPGRFGSSNQPQIEEGAQVRERQPIFRLPDINNMRVNTKVHESQIDRVEKGLKSKIRVDAFPGDVFDGTVDSVAPLPDSANFFASDVKVYTTQVTIDKANPALRPGMTAQVEILIKELDDVLAVPVQAILQVGGVDTVFVKNGSDWKRTEIAIGDTNDQLIEITKGLKDGDEVALAPVNLLTDDEKRSMVGPGKATRKRAWGEQGKTEGEGKGGDAAKGEEKGKAKSKRGGGAGAFNPAMLQKFQNLSEDERAQMKSADESTKKSLMKKAGFTDAEIQQLNEAAKNFGGAGGGGGGFGGGGRGPGGGGPGGGPGGGRGPGGGGGRPGGGPPQ